MADYNVNMKQWNGTSFDNVLPLAYNAKQLEGQSLAEVKQWVQANGLMLYTGQYTGTGTHGASSPMVFTFPFEPIVLFMPIIIRKNYSPLFNPIICSSLTESYQDVGPAFYYPNNLFLSMKMSADKKSVYWYVTGGVGSEIEQANLSGYIYNFAAIGGYDMGGQTEWTITQSGTWTAPRTGRYLLELYGMGGNGYFGVGRQASGGASCQHYDSINLTKGDEVHISIGSTSVSSTSFGTYSVANAGAASQGVAGIGTGNRGANGKVKTESEVASNTFGSGLFSSKYGYGGASGGIDLGPSGGPGAVYLKYLGA